ncbi:hypothetical protein DIS24_g3305 [Lasiodiplodia hormozganensis]|uniref:Autophagy protein n=1 Tax=Lasiodiplodia hormozganensis TaxID=869390 RepID=A0AA40D4N8_9PEZI|nr:hypothetical protein DIS24_g3305 [Lasiodiplodia hormozganensis]
MGWFWGSSDSSASADPAKQLDPGLKKFLDQESPSPPPAASVPAAQPSPAPQSAPATTSASVSSADAAKPAAVPAESLYQDGRYAHLWKNYEPLSAIEARSKSDQEKLTDIVSAYNDRRAGIGRAALENCAFQQLALSDCYKSGTWMARITMCRTETQALDRCYTMQSRFLKALGYLSVQGQGRDAEERVQMHADRLYQRMLEQERLVAEAKEKGEEPPKFGSILSRENVAAAMRGDVAPLTVEKAAAAESAKAASEKTKADEAKAKEAEERELARSLDEMPALAPKMRKEFEDRLRELHGEERDIELRAIQGEFAESRVIAKQVEAVFEEEKVKRLERQARGKETMGDTIKRWWGW